VLDDHTASQWNGKRTFSEDNNRIVASRRGVTAIKEKPRMFPGIMIGQPSAATKALRFKVNWAAKKDRKTLLCWCADHWDAI
jgi:hypothetical protein